MLRPVLLLLALAVPACADRELDEERPSRRHLAAEWCEDWCTFWTACEPGLADWSVTECRERCESDEAWDWTDECGDIIWEYRECRDALTCEEARGDPDDPHATPACQEHYTEFVERGCSYVEPHGG